MVKIGQRIKHRAVGAGHARENIGHEEFTSRAWPAPTKEIHGISEKVAYKFFGSGIMIRKMELMNGKANAQERKPAEYTREAFRSSGPSATDHFEDVLEMVKIGQRTKRRIVGAGHARENIGYGES